VGRFGERALDGPVHARRRANDLAHPARHGARPPEEPAACGEGWIATAVMDGDAELLRYEVDATAGDEVERDGVLAFIDLDIDLEIEGGTALVSDLVQFAERREEMGYPPGLLSAVVVALDKALRRHRQGDWPFDGSLR
jgi:hypothetical protein